MTGVAGGVPLVLVVVALVVLAAVAAALVAVAAVLVGLRGTLASLAASTEALQAEVARAEASSANGAALPVRPQAVERPRRGTAEEAAATGRRAASGPATRLAWVSLSDPVVRVLAAGSGVAEATRSFRARRGR